MAEVERVELPSEEVVFYRDSQHAYYRGYDEKSGKCSQRIPGISTIAKALDTNADPLITWGAKLEAQGVCDLFTGASFEEFDSMLSNGGEALHRELVARKLDWRSVRNQRATEGTNVHELVFAALGRDERPSLGDLTDEERGYGQAAFRFWKEVRPKPIAVEQVVYLPEQGAAPACAGRFDLLAVVDGQVVLYDAKTSKSAYLSHHVQLVGYRLGCLASGFDPPEREYVLLLRADGSYELVEGVATVADFDIASRAYDAVKRISKAQREGRKAVAA